MASVLALTAPRGPGDVAQPRPTTRSWRLFLTAAIPAALCAAALTVWLGFVIGGEKVTTAVSDIGQAVPALAAAASCGWAACRAEGRLRAAWALLGASACAWGLGEVIWSYYTVVRGVAVPFPSAADAGFLAAIPFAVAGVLFFPSAPTRGTTRARAVLDGSIVALSLLFVSWALGLGEIYRQSPAGLVEQAIGLAYPIGDIVILTVLFVAFSRSLPAQWGRLVLLMLGLGANAFSDSTFAFLTASGSFLTSSYLFSTGWIDGYLLMALAPLWPERAPAVLAEEGAMTVPRAMLPWVGLIAVVATAVVLVATGQPMDPFLTLPAAGLVLVLMASQALSYRDSLGLLAASRRTELALKERSTMLNQVIDNAPQGVARISLERVITNANPRLGAILGMPADALAGVSLDRFVDSSSVDAAFAGFARVADGSNDTFATDSQAHRADGIEFWMRWSATAIRKLDGTIDYFMGMFEDTTAKHQAEEAAAATLSALEKLNRLKSEFVSSVSHEFRTALVGIEGFSELLRDDEVPSPEVHSIAADINSEAERLSRMITEMLDLDRMEAGKIVLKMQPLHMNDLVRDAVERARVSTEKHHVVTDMQPNVPLVLGDADRLTQVLTNLLSNAIKYSPDGGEVCVRTRAVGGAVEVCVADHGRGIPPEFISRLFGRYERYEDKHAGKIIGTGLGLAITRQIVEMHGG
ncbi:MAG TPA: PAS domain-containing sensor histidine kinase, partial [Candidatus Dormibacteraeota bacterium]|nr:PAS domain-containing sensor histidine kinase [Candidatus Dormibacteraeota bacterium]